MVVKCTIFSLFTAAVGSVVDPHIRDTDPVFKSPTWAKVDRVALCALPGLLSALAMNCANTDQQKYTGGAFGLLAGSGLALLGAIWLNDYEDPKEIQAIRRKASGMSWEELNHAHKLPLIVSKEIVPKDTLVKEFEKAHFGLRFTEITEKYPVSFIQKYQLCNPQFLQNAFLLDLQAARIEFLLKVDLEELNGILENPLFDALKDIKTRWTTQVEELTTTLAALDAAYPNRREKRSAILEAKKQQIEDRLKHYEEELKKPGFHPDNKAFAGQMTLPGLSGQPIPRRTVAQERDRLNRECLLEKYDTEALYKAEDAQCQYNFGLTAALHKKEQKEIALLAHLNELLVKFPV